MLGSTTLDFFLLKGLQMIYACSIHQARLERRQLRQIFQTLHDGSKGKSDFVQMIYSGSYDSYPDIVVAIETIC
jgi:hypothetical protein